MSDDPVIVNSVTQSLQHIRSWLNRPDARLDDRQREILYDIVSITLADSAEEVAEVAEDWPIVDRIVEIRNALSSAAYATEDSMNLLARVRLQLHAYERGMRHNGLLWQMTAAVRTFNGLATTFQKGDEDATERSNSRDHRRRR